jgi:hypothetical protein
MNMIFSLYLLILFVCLLALHFDLDDGGIKLVRNIRKLLLYYTAHIPDDSRPVIYINHTFQYLFFRKRHVLYQKNFQIVH